MSVRKYERTEGKLQVLKLSMDLAKYSTTICNNSSIFPKSMRFTLSNKIIDSSIKIMENISLANEVSLTDYPEQRKIYQNKALATLSSLETLVRFSYEVLDNLSGNRTEYWTGLIEETKKTLRNWIKSDEKRIKK